MVKLGVVVILVSVVLFVGAMVAPQTIAPLGPLYCPGGQTMTSQTFTYSRSGETESSNNFYCVDSDGVQKSDVTGAVTVTFVAIFAVLLLAGIGLTIVGSRRLAVQANWQQPNYGSASGARALRFSTTSNDPNNPTNSTYNGAVATNVQDIMDGLQRGVVRFGGQEVSIADLKSGAYQHQVTADSKRTLADTLKQLSDAHTQGLINDDEYAHLRQEALDKLV